MAFHEECRPRLQPKGNKLHIHMRMQEKHGRLLLSPYIYIFIPPNIEGLGFI